MPKVILIAAHNRIGLSRFEAAQYIGVSVGTFNLLVKQGIMPMPRKIGSRLIWSRYEIEEAFEKLKSADQKSEASKKFSIGGVDIANDTPASNPWRVKA